MTDRPPQPPEGKLISVAIKRFKMSQREAARRAGISESWLRQILNGYQTISGSYVPVRGPADTVARIAQVARVTPEQLEEVGRPDAAQELRALPAEPEPPERLTLSALAAIVETASADVHLRRLLELWPRTEEWQRRMVVGVLEQALNESPTMPTAVRKPEQEDERRAM